jgi:uncharacterized membrane protein YjgN (DUF898 family)
LSASVRRVSNKETPDVNDESTILPTPPAAPAPAPFQPRTAYDGRAGCVGGIVLGNTLLGVLTLGFYRFWGRTRLRRHLWNAMTVWGDRLRYTGTGMELFVGFLIALVILVPLGAAAGAIGLFTVGWSPKHQIMLQIGFYLVFMFLYALALFRARRYKLTRTTWREIRAGQTGSSFGYALRWMGYALMTWITGGLTWPIQRIQMQAYLTRHTWFGDRPFTFNGSETDIYPKWLLCWVLILPTLGLSLVWYSAYSMRYVASRTGFDNLRFSLSVTMGDLLKIYVPYFLLLIALTTLAGLLLADSFVALDQVNQQLRAGSRDPALNDALFWIAVRIVAVFLLVFAVIMPPLAAMMVVHRLFALYAERLSVQGEPDFERIAQSARTTPGSGEGLADAFDVGGF